MQETGPRCLNCLLLPIPGSSVSSGQTSRILLDSFLIRFSMKYFHFLAGIFIDVQMLFVHACVFDSKFISCMCAETIEVKLVSVPATADSTVILFVHYTLVFKVLCVPIMIFFCTKELLSYTSSDATETRPHLLGKNILFKAVMTKSPSAL